MSWQKPNPAIVWKAIDAYLKGAYPADPPAPIRQRLESLRAVADAAFLASDAFERDSSADPSRYALRLGNRFFPHMKLVIERSPDGGYLFRADTHDRHCQVPPSSPEYADFCQLMARNHQIAQAIELAWENQGLPTFKTFLRRDLDRRRRCAEGRSERQI